jgi:hypothetical protein
MDGCDSTRLRQFRQIEVGTRGSDEEIELPEAI